MGDSGPPIRLHGGRGEVGFSCMCLCMRIAHLYMHETQQKTIEETVSIWMRAKLVRQVNMMLDVFRNNLTDVFLVFFLSFRRSFRSIWRCPTPF